MRTDKTTYPKNCAPAGPISTSLLANPSPSTMGGGLASLCLFTKRQVIRVGAVHLRGGMMILIPWCRLPLIEPPLASTIKLTRNLRGGRAEAKSRRDRSRFHSESGNCVLKRQTRQLSFPLFKNTSQVNTVESHRTGIRLVN